MRRIDPNSALHLVEAGAGAAVRVPKVFDRLYDLSHNMWWAWDDGAKLMWSQIEPRQWYLNRNPLSMLLSIDTETWEALAANESFVELYEQVVRRFDTYMSGHASWYETNHSGELSGPVVYLCAEFGVHHTLPFYSGGLGVLAGDHAKSASDLGLPFVGVGLCYRRGYFHQSIDPDGWQQHHYTRLEMTRRPFREVVDRNGRPLRVSVEFPDREVTVRAWRLDVGRVPLLLLDTFLAENDPADRPITQILYVRGRAMRFAQEMVLGIGGARVVEALRIEPAAWHVNEGHAALSLLERVSRLTEQGVEFDAAQKTVERNTLFTLHTPVAAGNEVFDLDLAERYIDGTLAGVPDTSLADFGRARDDHHGRFDMGAVAIKLSAMTNGVSKRHGEIVSRDWSHLIGGPALAVTNGVHVPTWVGRAVNQLYQRAIGHDWWQHLGEPGLWAEAIAGLPDQEVWDAHCRQKVHLLLRMRERLLDQQARHGASPDDLHATDDQLPAERLTIVFGRRFAAYKRAGLFFTDPDRARAILKHPERPVQMIFTGKAHPADHEGRGLIRWVAQQAQSDELRGHLFFAEDYDMQLGAWLVSGADVWLNNPRPPLEASGTSGMKAAANGGLNLSVLDGWWLEGYDGDNGWTFGEDSQSDAEHAAALYHVLEDEVVPKFYDRDEEGIPREWVRMMKAAMAGITPAFSTHRMVAEYAERAYLPLAKG